MLRFSTGLGLGSPDADWNRLLMKVWLVKNPHENSKWVKIWLSMDSTFRIFLKTNSSLYDLAFPHLASKKLFSAEFIVFYI